MYCQSDPSWKRGNFIPWILTTLKRLNKSISLIKCFQCLFRLCNGLELWILNKIWVTTLFISFFVLLITAEIQLEHFKVEIPIDFKKEQRSHAKHDNCMHVYCRFYRLKNICHCYKSVLLFRSVITAILNKIDNLFTNKITMYGTYKIIILLCLSETYSCRNTLCR
jgi:hypothetical protein